jgi:hypothetical protein
VLVRQVGPEIEILRDGVRLALHTRCPGHHQCVTLDAHHAGIPTTNNAGGKPRLSLTVCAPEVEVRSLSVYAALEEEGGAA